MSTIKHRCRSAAVAACVAAVGSAAQSQTLPPPPVSPAPVINYEYDAQGHPTRTIQAPGVSGFGFATRNTPTPGQGAIRKRSKPLDRLQTTTCNRPLLSNERLFPRYPSYATTTSSVRVSPRLSRQLTAIRSPAFTPLTVKRHSGFFETAGPHCAVITVLPLCAALTSVMCQAGTSLP